MNNILRQIFELRETQEELVGVITIGLRSALETHLERAEKDAEEGLITEEGLIRVQEQIRGGISHIREILTSKEYLDKLLENTSAVITEHISDELLQRLLDFESSPEGQQLTAAGLLIDKTVNKIGLQLAKELLVEHGLDC